MSDDITPDFTVRDVCKLLKMSERFVRKHISEGTIPSYRIGTTVRIPREGIRRLRMGRNA